MRWASSSYGDYRAIGQALYYFVKSREIPTFIAAPNDSNDLAELVKIIDFFKLPIGIITVNPNNAHIVRGKLPV
jgi:hypothetical protein